ncbi:MAG: cytochrome b N-terminal domain-containing protein [Pirellulaceae bacterium]
MKVVIAGFTNWLDHRTGYRQMMHEALYEHVPGGSSWMYIWGSMLVFAFVTQAVTGIFLWMSYSAGSQNAWESVYYIQNEMQGGWLLRGVHHYMAQAMVVLLPVHLLQVVLYRAYSGPREMNYWTGLVLMLITLGLGLTGYLLPWDQKGYWATKVATELMSLPPGGAYIQKLVVGGENYGHFTLTRFFAMHAGVLPALLVAVLGLHLTLFRRHGVTTLPQKWRDDEYFWPGQVFKDAVGCLALLGVVLYITIDHHGAELGPPAEPTEAYGAARPEWYYLFLFQLLKKFHNEFVGAIVVPGLVMGFLFALPVVARIKYGHVVNVVVIITLIIGAGYLTYEAIYHDQYATLDIEEPSDTKARLRHLERVNASREYQEARHLAEHEYERTRELVSFYGIPKQGAASSIVHDDPEIQGPRIFKRNCASCHSYLNEEGEGIAGPRAPRDDEGNLVESPEAYAAPNLYGFATRQWFVDILDPKKVADHDMFGSTSHAEGDMAAFVKDELDGLNPDQQRKLEQIVAALSAEASLASQIDDDAKALADGTLEQGRAAVAEAIDSQACTDCHKFHDEGELGYGPDLTGYGSYEWLYGLIANPAHERFYGDSNDRMPLFAEHPETPSLNLLSPHEMDMLVRWLRGDDRDLALAAERRKLADAMETVTEAQASDSAESDESN